MIVRILLNILIFIFGAMSSTPNVTADSLRKPPSATEYGAGSVPIRLWRERKLLWTVNADSEAVAVFPHRGLVVYNGETGARPDTLYGRTFEGRIRWKSILSDYVPEFGFVRFLSGKDTLFVLGRGPLPHLRQEYVDASFVNDVLDAYWVRTFHAESGSPLWSRTTREIGTPIWTDGTVFVTLHAIPAYGKHPNGPAPVIRWLEKRHVSNAQVLWRCRVMGNVAGSVDKPSVRVSEMGRKIRVRLATDEGSKFNKRTFLSLDVPVNSPNGTEPEVTLSPSPQDTGIDIHWKDLPKQFQP